MAAIRLIDVFATGNETGKLGYRNEMVLVNLKKNVAIFFLKIGMN